MIKDITQRRLFSGFLAAIMLCAAGCGYDMRDQPRYEPYEKSEFFEDGRADRPFVEGTVPRGELREDDHLYRGQVDGQIAETFPFPVTETLLERGQERYNIFCSHCHDRAGTGQGMVVKRGFKQPTSFHEERMSAMPAGYYFNVITNGFGAMPAQADKISPEDRWAIAAYIHVLQFSQRAPLDKLPEEDQKHFEGHSV